MKMMFIPFIIVFIIIIAVWIFMGFMIFNPKLRGKMMSKQMKSLRHMTDYSKEDIEAINRNVNEAMIDSKNSILSSRKEVLKNIADTETDIQEDSIRRKTKALRDGLMGDEHRTEFCKYCGNLIDKDSKFCRVCGKKLK